MSDELVALAGLLVCSSVGGAPDGCPVQVIAGRAPVAAPDSAQDWIVTVPTERKPVIASGRVERYAPVMLLSDAPEQGVRVVTRQVFRLAPFHTYRISMVLGGPPCLHMSFGFTVSARGERGRPGEFHRAWPQRHGGFHVVPGGRPETGFFVNGPGERSARLFIERGTVPDTFRDGRFPYFVHKMIFEDCGDLTGDGLAVNRLEEFDRPERSLTSMGYAVSFAGPDQLAKTMADGCSVLHNRNGRALVWAPAIPARFGSVYRMSVRARGAGTIRLRFVPYMDKVGRFHPTGLLEADLERNEWSELVMQAGQNVPQADRLRPQVDMQGSVSLDRWVVEGPLPRERLP